jgi:hypothetical protein
MFKKKKHISMGAEIKDYIVGNCKRHRIREQHHACTFELYNFYKVTSPLSVFKKIYTKANGALIANLIIPVGAKIYVGESFGSYQLWDNHSRKMRASEAYVHSIVTANKQKYHDSKSKFIYKQKGYSGHDNSFVYIVGKTIKPDKFSHRENICDSGIHFFLDVADALDW